MICLPESVQRMIKALCECSDSSKVDLGERREVSLAEAYLLNKLFGPKKAALVIERITTSDSKGRKLADKIKKASKRMTQGKGNLFKNSQKFDEESRLRQLLLSLLEMPDSDRPLLMKKKGDSP